MGYKQVQLAVVVIVEPYSTAREAGAPYFRPGRHIGKAAVAKIPEEMVRSYCGDVDVVLAVVVVVADRAAHAVHLHLETCLAGTIRESSISIVVIEGRVV